MRHTKRRSRLAIYVAACAAVMGAACGLADEGGTWIGETPMIVERQECGAARLGGTIYVVGGLLEDFSATDSVEAYDIATGTWREVSPLPSPRDHPGVAVCDGTLYVLGGFERSHHGRDEVFAYDPARDEWTERAPMPGRRGACWAVAHRGLIYVFGGQEDDVSQASTFIYDPALDEWSVGRDMPTARDHLTAAAVGEYIYVIGGRNLGDGGQEAQVFDTNERYHPASNTWATMAPMPNARSASGTAAFGRRIIVAGGEIPRLFEVNEVYDVLTDTWSCLADMPTPRHGFGAVTLSDRLFMPAGGLILGLDPTNIVESFIPPPATNGDIADFTFVSGVQLGGGLAELYESDEWAFEAEAFVTGKVAEPHRLEIVFGAFSDFESPAEIDIVLEARISDIEATTWMFMRDWQRDQLEQVAQFTVGFEEHIERLTVPDAGRFIRSGDGRIELMVKQVVFVPFTLGGFISSIDQLEMTAR